MTGSVTRNTVENLPIDRRQRAQVGDRHALVDRMHGLPDQAEFHHRAKCVMKRASEVPPVVDSSGLRPVTSLTAFATSSVNGPGLVTNTSAFDGSHSNAKLYFAAGGLGRALLDQRFQRLRAYAVVEADVEARPRFAGNEIDGLVADIDRGEFQMRGWKLRAAVVERLGLAAPRSASPARGSDCRRAADRRHGPACRCTIRWPLSEPRRPILMVSPSSSLIARLAQNAVIEFFAVLGRPFNSLGVPLTAMPSSSPVIRNEIEPFFGLPPFAAR